MTQSLVAILFAPVSSHKLVVAFSLLLDAMSIRTSLNFRLLLGIPLYACSVIIGNSR